MAIHATDADGSTTDAMQGVPSVRVNGTRCHKCHFELAPPRHFLYPAILLLIGEEARHGYRLVDALLRFGFGPVDRPSIYRALADLDHDGLVVTWEAESTAGSNRHMYALSDAGREQLSEWMTIMAAERDGLDRVVQRFEDWERGLNP